MLLDRYTATVETEQNLHRGSNTIAAAAAAAATTTATATAVAAAVVWYHYWPVCVENELVIKFVWSHLESGQCALPELGNG